MVKCLQVLLFNISNSIYVVFLSNIDNLHTAVSFQITNNNNNNPLEMIEQFYFIRRWNSNKYDQSRLEWTRE